MSYALQHTHSHTHTHTLTLTHSHSHTLTLTLTTDLREYLKLVLALVRSAMASSMAVWRLVEMVCRLCSRWERRGEDT